MFIEDLNVWNDEENFSKKFELIFSGGDSSRGWLVEDKLVVSSKSESAIFSEKNFDLVYQKEGVKFQSVYKVSDQRLCIKEKDSGLWLFNKGVILHKKDFPWRVRGGKLCGEELVLRVSESPLAQKGEMVLKGFDESLNDLWKQVLNYKLQTEKLKRSYGG